MQKEDIKDLVTEITQGIHDALKEVDNHTGNDGNGFSKTDITVDFSFTIGDAHNPAGTVSFQVPIKRS